MSEVWTDLNGRPIPDLERYARPHGDECSCLECLRAWTGLVAARYVAVSIVHEIPDSEFVLILPWWWEPRGCQVWRRDDYLRRLKALAVAVSEPYRPLRVECDARPVLSIPEESQIA